MKQIRNTRAKSAIIKVINDSPTALAHSEIQDALQGLCDRVTIYRVLERLTEEGTVHKFTNIDGVAMYVGCQVCSNEHHDHHIHFNCEKCKSVYCLEDVEPTFHLPDNYQVKQLNFTVLGICPKCLKGK